jgi:hypothetical protein
MSDILAGISILLVFLTVLLSFISNGINDLLRTPKPGTARAEARVEFNSKLRFALFAQSIPVTLVFILVWYVLLPQTATIISTCHFDIWNFDTLKTIFVLIELGVLGFIIYSGIQTSRLISKLLN